MIFLEDTLNENIHHNATKNAGLHHFVSSARRWKRLNDGGVVNNQ